jgi:hypothetical protein
MSNLPHRRPRRAWLALAAIPLVVGALFANTTEGRAILSLLPVDLAGSYSGWMTVEGNDLQVTLTLTQQGDTLGVRMAVPDLGSVTQGSGMIDGEGFMLQVPYDLGCPGQATFRGQQDAETRALRGSIQAADCNGTMSGSFRLSPSSDDR